jgi:hypothetical protein
MFSLIAIANQLVYRIDGIFGSASHVDEMK